MSSVAKGLTSEEVSRLLTEHGPNALPEKRPVRLWLRFARQFKSPLIYMLLFAMAFNVAVSIYERWKDLPVEAWVIGAVLLLNAVLGMLQERRSEKALAQLKALTPSRAWVWRDGKLVEVASRELVPGDVVRIEAGERIPADGSLLDGVGVLADEAVLTGESVPVDKPVGAELQSGTLLVRGQGAFQVARTGARSAMGEIATLLGEVETEKTPLERQLAKLGTRIARWIGALTVVLIAGGLWVEGIGQVGHVVMFAVALAVAGIPEGMPAVVTLTLALGVQRMARRHALVRRLSAVEALGSVTVIATDKTGTLTEEKMTVGELESDDPDAALAAMVLANDADTNAAVGDPLDMALLEYARKRGIDVGAVRDANVRVDSRPFDSSTKCMSVIVKSLNARRMYLKGAPEVLVARCDLSSERRAHWLARAHAGASAGFKVLALARRDGEHEVLLGLVTLWDPPRPEVPAAIDSAHRAGVR
ncbi:MAG TPA: HAD-IC family P-type ATPase, partial [Polyangiaceae bacterium]|nr:HAD-IC family P-type ATPase [Polyangiaceae bacterium]